MISSPQLKGEIRKQLEIRNWGYRELARQTGYTEPTVRTYMSNEPRKSMRFEQCVRRVLKISEV